MSDPKAALREVDSWLESVAAAGTDLRITLLRYQPVPETVWRELYVLYQLAIDQKGRSPTRH